MKILFLLIFLLSFQSLAETREVDRLTDGSKHIDLDWDRGWAYEKETDLSWGIYSCDEDAKFACLIVEGYGVEIAYPKNMSIGESWSFDGRIYMYAMNISGSGERLIFSRFSEATMGLTNGPKINSLNIIRLQGDNLKEYVSYQYSPNLKETSRWISSNKKGLVLIKQLDSTSKTKIVSDKQVENCLLPNNINCLGR